MEKDLDFFQFCEGLIDGKLEKRIIKLILENKSSDEIVETLVKEHREVDKNAKL